MKTVVNASLSEQVYDILKRSIIERQLPVNSKLDINALSQRMGVSRMPVMDALTRLEAEGLVTRRSRVGTFVTPLDKAMFEEIFEAREMIERWTTPRAIENQTEADIAELRDLLHKSGALLIGATDETFDYRAFTEYDQRFHLKLVSLGGNTRILSMYTSLNSHMQIARAYSLRALRRSREGQEEHRAILEAFSARDVKRTLAAQSDHLQRSRAGIMALLDEHGVL